MNETLTGLSNFANAVAYTAGGVAFVVGATRFIFRILYFSKFGEDAPRPAIEGLHGWNRWIVRLGS